MRIPVFTGLRRGEVPGILREDINLDDQHSVQVTKKYAHNKVRKALNLGLYNAQDFTGSFTDSEKYCEIE